jgi:hypothetical protein
VADERRSYRATDETRRVPTVSPEHRATGQRNHAAEVSQQPWVMVADRARDRGGRSSPRMRFDVLQIVAWLAGLYFLVVGLVAVARVGLDGFDLFGGPVEVGQVSATPFLAIILWLVGLLLLAGGSGIVAERRLRFGGVGLCVAGIVFLIEPNAFADHLGVTADTGARLLAIGLLVTVASFVPPLSIKRPGVPPTSNG